MSTSRRGTLRAVVATFSALGAAAGGWRAAGAASGSPAKLAQSGPGPEWVSLAVLATPESPLMLTGNENLPNGSLVATRRIGDSLTLPAASSLRVRGSMTVFGTQGGIIITNLAESGDPRARRIYLRGINRGDEWHVAYQGQGAERAAPVLVLPGGDHGNFELILDADGQHGAIVYDDDTLGVFDLGEDFFAATGGRGFATLLYGTLRTRVVIPRLELLAYKPLAA